MAKDKYHDIVKRALEKERWKITHDPLRIKIGTRKVEIDLGAQRMIGAEKEGVKIAVEIKSFLSLSELTDFYTALGQYQVYLKALEQKEPQRTLYLAVPDDIFEIFFNEELPKIVIDSFSVKVIAFNIENEEIVVWKK